jgi:hypothetical protein
MTPTKIKLCKDCLHFMPEDCGFSKCARTKYKEPVEGRNLYISCGTERKDYVGCCGPDAKFFKAK